MDRSRVRRASRIVLVIAVLSLLAGCGGNDQSTLDPQSHPANSIANLFWGMLVAAAIVFAGTVILIAIAYARRNRTGLPLIGQEPAVSTGLVVAFGIVIPVLALSALFFISDIGVLKATEAPSARKEAFTINVIAHQWWWEFRYPQKNAITANEMHIPVGTHVHVRVTTADVIHSFWVPELNRKIDTIPGHPNTIDLYAPKAGVYRGQCAEFCGLQHANMSFAVYAQPMAAYQAWVAGQAKPVAQAATTHSAGMQTFMSGQCASCHTIRGTAASGLIGPDLTHLQTRKTIAALTIPNTRSFLDRWIRDPQHFKEGAKMPGLHLTNQQFRELDNFLGSLK